jgi:fructose/tagatose bisphosphate aldolase
MRHATIDLLKAAYGRYALGAFNVCNMDEYAAFVAAKCEELGATGESVEFVQHAEGRGREAVL